MIIADVTVEQVEESKKLAVKLHKHIVPVLMRWIEKCRREGVHENVICMTLSAEALTLSSHNHIGDPELFLQMAKVAITQKFKCSSAMH